MNFNINNKIFIDRVSNDCILSDNKFIKIYNFFLINNYIILDNYINADVVILDLCWVNNNFLLETYKKIDNYLEKSKKVVLFWCVSPILREKYSDNVIYVSSNDYKNIENYFIFNFSISNIDSLNYKNKLTILDIANELNNYKWEFPSFEKKAFIEISSWCQFNCSYCNIKKIKWDTNSIQISEIINWIKNELKKWKTEFHLLSDDCWSYWIDIWVTFPDLLDEIFLLDSNIKIFISNIFPSYLLKYYDKIKKYIYENKIAYIIVPIQHTSKKILKLMNRSYDINDIIYILNDIKLNSNTKLCNHTIFNYHTETLEDFVGTFKVLKYYDKNFYFKYSDINKTFWKDFVSIKLEEKIILLKKLQKKYNIDITL